VLSPPAKDYPCTGIAKCAAGTGTASSTPVGAQGKHRYGRPDRQALLYTWILFMTLCSLPPTVPSRPLIFFSHANSFPAGTYRKLFQQLSPRYRVEALDRYGHDPEFPVTDGWSHLVRQ